MTAPNPARPAVRCPGCHQLIPKECVALRADTVPEIVGYAAAEDDADTLARHMDHCPRQQGATS